MCTSGGTPPGMPSTLQAVAVQQLECARLPPPPAMCAVTPSVGLAPASSRTSASGRCSTAQIAPHKPSAVARDASSSGTRRSGSRRGRRAAARWRRVRPARVGVAAVHGRCGRRRAAAPSSAVRPAAWRARDVVAVARPRAAASPRTSAVCSDAVAIVDGGREVARRVRCAPPVAQRMNSSTAASNDSVRARLLRAVRSTTRSRARARLPTARRAAPDRLRRSRRGTYSRAKAERRIAGAPPGRAPGRVEQGLACFFRCSRFGRSGSSRDGIRPPCLCLVVRRQAARRCSGRWSSSDDSGLGPSREPAGAL